MTLSELNISADKAADKCHELLKTGQLQKWVEANEILERLEFRISFKK